MKTAFLLDYASPDQYERANVHTYARNRFFAVRTVIETVLKTKHDQQTSLRAGSLLRRHWVRQRLAQSAGQPQCQRSCIKIGSEPN